MRSRVSPAGWILLGLVLLVSRPGHAQVFEGRELVKAELIADVSAIVPGKPFRAGLLLHIAPRWHTYWKYSGDAGIPIELKWHLPPGWKAGELEWPVPLKFDDAGDIKTYGYHDEVLLTQELTPPASLSDQEVKLGADANWLVCEKICVPGSAPLELKLPVGQGGTPVNVEIFARYKALEPRADSNLSVQWERSDHGLLLRARSPSFAQSSLVDFYPSPEGNVVVGHPALQSRAGDQAVFLVPLESGDAGVTSLPGLIVYGQQSDGSDRAGLTISTASGGASVPRVSAAIPQSRGLLAYLFFGFLGGLILNLMPCVLPVISLKIFGFVQHAGSDRRQILRSGLAFIAGIFAWFLAVATLLILLKNAGSGIGWSIQFTNSYFVLGLSVIVLAFALNLFGVFEITLPQSANRGLLSASEGSGNASSFFQGLFATILGTSCTAPVLGYAVGFALTQSSVVIILMFLAVATGMALPYFLLSAQPGWVKFLPKPGAWMERVKQLMGFPMLATLVFLLYVLGAQRGLEALTWASAFLLVVALVCWMKGAFIVPTASAAARAWTFALMIFLLAASGIYFIGNQFAAAKLSTSTNLTAGDWQAFTPEKLQAELQQGHAAFVDFTAAWCITCKFNEASVLESAAVRDAFKAHAVTKLRADWTNGDPVITKLLQRFGRPGVPLYVLYPGKDIEPIVFPELLTKGMVLDKLESLTQRVVIK